MNFYYHYKKIEFIKLLLFYEKIKTENVRT